MSVHPLAGKPMPDDQLPNISRLISAYYTQQPDPTESAQRVTFGTSGHRGSSTENRFNEHHVIAICQAIAEYRKNESIDGPLFIGMDTHALSEAALRTSVEVLAANDVSIILQTEFGYTPTPVISHAILTYNHERKKGLSDGIIITPSHNPPIDGGFKYNPPSGGPAGSDATKLIEARANQILAKKLQEVRRIPFERAITSDFITFRDYIKPYVDDLASIIDMPAIASSGLRIGVDPLGGSGIHFWEPIAETYGLNIEVVNRRIDPAFAFMPLDRDGKIRMDCSSPWAMAGLINLKDQFDIAFGNDPDYDRHGIVTKSGLMNPNHYLAVAIDYLFRNRKHWPEDVAIGKTLVSSSMIDRVAASLPRRLCEVPVGFKYFVDGLLSGELGFGGEESAGAAFLRKNGSVWTTDKDGIIMDLLAAEITAKTNADPAEHYRNLETTFGSPVYTRINADANTREKNILKNLNADQITAKTMAGENIISVFTHADCKNEAIGGLKVVTENGWFAARPSGTEDIYKIYAESFNGKKHLASILDEAQSIVNNALKGSK